MENNTVNNSINEPVQKPASCQKCNGSKPALIALICIVIIALVGVGGYALFKNLTSENDKLQKQIQDLQAIVNSDSKDEKTTEKTTEKTVEKPVEKECEGITFEQYVNGIKEAISNLPDGEEYRHDWRSVPGNGEGFTSYTSYIDNNGDLYLNNNKIASGVIDQRIIFLGNGGQTYYVFFVREDGTVSRTGNIFENSTNPKIFDNILGLKNIISVHGMANAGGSNVAFTDFEGNLLTVKNPVNDIIEVK